MKDITKEQWEQEILNSDKPTLVDFWATWCGACSTVAPIVEKIAKEYDGKIKFIKVDVDQNKEIARNYNVSSIPTLAIFRDGKVIAQRTGTASKESIRAYIDEHIQQDIDKATELTSVPEGDQRTCR